MDGSEILFFVLCWFVFIELGFRGFRQNQKVFVSLSAIFFSFALVGQQFIVGIIVEYLEGVL